ncbi:PREDICTED: serine/arginine repetitive matrix protein 3-like [Branchiostoma belcheri]|uniref:Serine/arginine repetitive matrix protein 3-like n=1 Tax=Branchiostoma belcheri TaxID=7741 RepID=A0A6P4YRE9_BRABE|nr:PREDICTED: serine/arginine repetitive matrix protein 3-like [Branchiostoma belcheri]
MYRHREGAEERGGGSVTLPRSGAPQGGGGVAGGEGEIKSPPKSGSHGRSPARTVPGARAGLARESTASNRTLSLQSFCYPAGQAATPREGSQRSTTGSEGGRSSAPAGEVGRAEGVRNQRRGKPPRRHRPGPRDPPATARPSVCVRVRLADSAVRDPAARPAGGRVGRESAGPFLTGRLGR